MSETTIQNTNFKPNGKRPNPKKDKSARRKRNLLYWKTGGRQIFTETACPDCIKEQKLFRATMQKEKPAPVGMKYNLNQNIKCNGCKKTNEKSKENKSTK